MARKRKEVLKIEVVNPVVSEGKVQPPCFGEWCNSCEEPLCGSWYSPCKSGSK